MAKISRRNFMRGAAMGTMGAAAAGLLTACGNTASSTTSAPASSAASSEAASVVTKPSTPVDGKYVTKAMGHESWVHVATTFFEGKITACEVLSHEETIGIGNYACSRIPAAIVEHQSINVPNLRGSSITSMAVKAAVKEAIELAGYNVDDFSKEVTLDGEPVNLTRTEYDILKLLMEHPGEVFSPNQIYEQVWQDNPYGTENTVAVHIRHLREKVEYNPAEPRYLKVVWGRGYKMEGQV